ncbi:MAG: hypothetical protein IPK01_01985 [Acidobacteria bacterium]|nr:hypothetical protein [Acidobacteriota bacterium]
MRWYDKIITQTRFEDGSRELKKGELKGILVECFTDRVQELSYVGFEKGAYRFRRTAENEGFKVWQTVELMHSFSGRNISCSVSSCLNLNYLYSNQYNSGLLNPRQPLIGLKKRTPGIPLEEAYYFHNGRISTTTDRVKQICDDVTKFGLPFFERHLHYVRSSPLLNTGFDFVRKLEIDKTTLQEEMVSNLKERRYRISGIENPVYLELKRLLQSVSGQEREVRKQISKLAYELLELYWACE